MEKVFDKYKNVGVKCGKHINCRRKYNCMGKYKDIPLHTLWDEVMVFNPNKDFEYQKVIEVK